MNKASTLCTCYSSHYETSGTTKDPAYTKLKPFRPLRTNLDDNLQSHFKAGYDYEFVANIHDEVQIQVRDEHAERVAEICVATFHEVTEYFEFRIRLDGEAKIGNNWKETH